jgi:hypothetical protein
MKKHRTHPGFEFIFSLSLIVIMALPLLVFAQGTKDIEIKVTNGDTTINGKNIKELSPAERNQALKDLDNLGSINGSANNGRHRMMMRKRGLADTGTRQITIERRHLVISDRDPEIANEPGFKRDSTDRAFRFGMKRQGGKDSVFSFNYRMNDDRESRFDDRERNFDFRMRDAVRERFRHRNIQSFEYTNTGSDGMLTHVSFRVSDPSPEKLKAITGSEKAGLEIKDLNLVPEFSAGKTLLLFSLPSKTVAEVKLTDNEGKLIWSAQTVNGNFNKSFALGLNGVYFLQVKQGARVALKRIVKED